MKVLFFNTIQKAEGVMKALKLNMVLAMITFTVSGLVSTAKKSVYLRERLYLTFDNAIHCDELILALYQQDQPALPRNHKSVYFASAIIDDVQYVIMGSYEQWKAFYSKKWQFLENNCPSVIGAN